MAKLRVAPKMIQQLLLPNCNAEIRGASYDAEFGVVVLDLVGPDVPEGADIVSARITQRYEQAELVKVT